MRRQLTLLLVFCVALIACRGKRASDAETRAAEAPEAPAQAVEERPAPLQADVSPPTETITAEGSGSGLAAPAALDRAFQLKRPSLSVKPMVGTQSITHDLRARTNAVKMHNAGIRVLMPKAVGAGPSAKPAPLPH